MLENSQIDRIRNLTPQLQLSVISNLNSMEIMIAEIISVDVCHNPRDIYKRTHFFKFFMDMNLQNKIDLLKIILNNNYPKISKQFPTFFTELGELKKTRDTIAHSSIAYEADPKGENARLLLTHPIIKKQQKLTERKIQSLIKKMEKVREETRKIWSLVGHENDLKFG